MLRQRVRGSSCRRRWLPPTVNSCQWRATQSTITTDFSTPCSRNAEAPTRIARLAAARGMSPTNRFVGLSCLTALLCLCWGAWAPPAHADTIPVRSAELLAEEESYVLNAQFDVAFNP